MLNILYTAKASSVNKKNALVRGSQTMHSKQEIYESMGKVRPFY